MSKRTCSIDGCDSPHYARGWCANHYLKWLRCGDPAGTPRIRKEGCSFPGCPGKHDSRGLCSAHALQARRGRELRPLRVYSYGDATCAVEGCGKRIAARGYCEKHWRAWRKYGDPLGTAPKFVRVSRPPGTARGVRRYTLDELFFDEILTEAQAYWLGFVTADGNITVDGQWTLRLELAERDQGHLSQMCADLGSDRPLLFGRSCACVSFGSRHLVESLGHLGVTPRKSATVEPWAGPADLMPHYWRGLFDGDGSIYQVGTRTDWCLNICGSRACVEGFAAWAKEITGARAKTRQIRDTCCWDWAVTGGRKPQLLAKALYEFATVALVRKRERADRLLALDFDALKVAVNARRRVAMKEAWATGRHSRAKR